MPKFRLAWIAALALACGSARAAPPMLTVAQARQAAEEVIRLVGADYVFPEKRAPIVEALETAQGRGRYDTENPAEFSERITADLRSASQDKHLWVAYDPGAYQDLLRQGGDDPGRSTAVREANRRRNQGFEELRILDGNIRYVRITEFSWSNDVTARIIDEVARFLGDGDAVVIDLRGNPGGNASSVERLISYFLVPDDRILMSFRDGLTGETLVNRVRNDLPSPRMAGRPLWVLIDGGTASAAEEFAYHVQQFKLGVLVGRTTAGAANNNERFPVAPGFVASVSVGRPLHPVSRTNWEGAGVAPDVATPPAAALDQAHLLALRRLAARAGEAERPGYEWPIAAIEARLHPLKLSPQELFAYAGKYGIRTIHLEKDVLVYQREGQDPTTLIPLAPDLFAFEDTAEVRVRFRRADGRVVGFDQVTADGQVIPSERTP
jgi:hypothetical protein